MPAELVVVLVAWALLCAAAYGLGTGFGKRGEPMRDWLRTRLRRRGGPMPQSRPIEAISADLSRLGARFHGLDPRTSFVKTEAVRAAYDRALSECCAAMGFAHLLGVLPGGAELDAERDRVEERLIDAGVRLPHAA
jgi:hypothetical protein